MNGSKKTGLSALIIILGFSITQAFGYDIIKRTKLIDDRLKTQEMLRPFGHDFLFDLSLAFTPETKDLMDDAEKLGKVSTDDTELLINEATTILTKYYDKENVGRVRISLGTPIFRFSAFGVNFRPNFRVDVGATVNLTPSAAIFNWSVFVDTVTQGKEDIPADAIALLKTCDPTLLVNGALLIDSCADQAGLTPVQKAIVIAQVGTEVTSLKWNTALLDSLPLMSLYAKADAKAGFPIDFNKGDHWFGTFFIGTLGRADLHKACDALAIAADQCETELADPNTVINAITEFKLGYKNSNYQAFAAFEEVKLAEISKQDTNAPLKYGSDPLIRLHASANYRLWLFSAEPFIGAHARSGYGFGDAYYLGADWGAHIWGDRLGVTLRTMADKEHFTFATRFKLWLMHLELTAKTPLASQVDGVKISEIYSANLRFFF